MKSSNKQKNNNLSKSLYNHQMKNMGVMKQNAISVHPQEMPCDVSHEILQDLPIATLSPRTHTAVGSIVQRHDGELNVTHQNVGVHEVYFNDAKNSKTRNEGEEFRSGSAHTKYGAPWVSNLQTNPSKAINLTNINTDKYSSNTGVSDFKTASRSQIKFQNNNSRKKVGDSLDADIESKAYDIDLSKSGASMPHNVGGLQNQQV